MAEEQKKPIKLAHASFFDGSISSVSSGGTTSGNYFMGDSIESVMEAFGNTSEKLILPKNYHRILKLCYDYYYRGGVASTVINRLTELAITPVRNGQRKTGQEANAYYNAMLERKPARLMRFLRFAALEYFLSGMVLPKIDWVEVKGSDLSPDLIDGKIYYVPVFDLYPPNLVTVVWANWGKKDYYLKIPAEDQKIIRSNGGVTKEQQLRYQFFVTNYPALVEQVKAGNNMIIIDTDPILRKEVTFQAYPTPFLYNSLESLIFRDQLRHMDFAVASRVINAILLAQEGNDMYPLTDDTKENLDNLQTQIMARTGNPKLLERLFILFSNHTTHLEWISPDVEALLNQEKYLQLNEDLSEALGFTRVLLTGESRNAQASELSTWAIQPMMEELRSMLMEWMDTVYEQAGELNHFKNVPDPVFKPIQLLDFIKTSAVYTQIFKEGNMSRTTRDELVGLDFESEQEKMLQEKALLTELNKGGDFPDPPYNVQVVPAPATGAFGSLGGRPASGAKGGRPTGSQNVPVNNRNAGVKPKGQKPTSQVRAERLWSDEEVIQMLDKVAKDMGIQIDLDMLNSENPPENQK